MIKNRGPWYLLTGLVIGVVIGLLYAWTVQPVQYTNTTPASLRPNFKDQYRSLIALAYLTNSDMVRAKARLELLKDEDAYRALAEQAQRTLAEGGFLQEARALGLLAASLGQGSATVDPNSQSSQATPSDETESPASSGTPATPSLTPSPTATSQLTKTPGDTFAPLPTHTPTLTPGAPFVLLSHDLVCDPNLDEALIQVLARDAADQPVPGVEVVVNWEGGENHFFTGLIPELGLDYADFSMTAGTTYTLRLAEGGEPITGLTPSECESGGGKRYWGSWRLIFSQP
ncbi:MAG: hypothetical protein KAJ53_04745 [Anaerolineales bacterium]|nr:hypothetical protein [Anaerolineales bacterium]